MMLVCNEDGDKLASRSIHFTPGKLSPIKAKPILGLMLKKVVFSIPGIETDPSCEGHFIYEDLTFKTEKCIRIFFYVQATVHRDRFL